MTSLEKKIINQVYRFETKKTLGRLILQVVGIILAIFFSYFFISIFIEELLQFKTWEVLSGITEDFEFFTKNFIDTVYIIYEETPKEILILTVFSLLIVGFLVLTITKNYAKIKNKLIALSRFWKKGG